MPPVRTLIIEDQPAHAAAVRKAMIQHSGFVILGQTATVNEAIALIGATEPDLLLLDIQLQDGSAFDLLDQLVNWSFKIIFLTAFETYAIRAIKVGALDYLLKPLDQAELAAALEKVEQLSAATTDQVQAAGHTYRGQAVERLALRDGPILRIIDLHEIHYLQSEGEYTVFYQEQGVTRVAQRLKEYEDLLPGQHFMRTHQSFLVNIAHVRGFHRDGYLLLRNGTQIPVSEKRREKVLQLLSRA